MIADQQIRRPLELIGQEYAAMCSQLGDIMQTIHEHEIKRSELHAKITMIKLEFNEAEALAVKNIAQAPPPIAEEHFVDEAHPFVSDVAP